MTIKRLYTFIDLFTVNDVDNKLPLQKIEIPIIQRDYAQGRQSDDVNRIRERFLSSLFNALTQNKPIKLDFIYGDINDKGVLIPLDGQQRLTTLFLLHWYIARHENVDDEILLLKGKFSYETRFSARTFCEKLLDYTPDLLHDNLSEEITDQSWMPLDWKHDPTINSMLIMLNDIHKMFRNTSGLWSRLKNGCITFYFLPLKDMGLSDDLYIKMNSRGKPLTEFEHFKAEWEHCISLLNKDLADKLGRKIDMEWTDLLWPYRGSNNIIDDEFIHFYRYLCAIIYYKKYPTETLPEDIFKLTKALFLERGEEDIINNLKFVELTFDSLVGKNIPQLFNSFLTKDNHTSGKSTISESLDVFEDCCNNFGEMQSAHRRSFPIGRMILLYCFLLYLRNHISDELFVRRLRIVNNLIKASEFELRDDRMNALLTQTEEIILKGEINNPVGRLSFNTFQLQEEKEKEEWLQTHSDKAETLFYLEDHPLLNGGISVIGLDYIDYADRFYSLFSCNRGLVNRALLTIDDYSIKVNWRYQIGSAKIDTSWRAIFRTSRGNDKTHETICNLLKMNDVFSDEYLLGVINDYLATTTLYDWRYYLVKYDSMRPERYGMYYWYEHKEREKESYRILMMLTEKSIGGTNYNIFLKTLLDSYPFDFTLGHYAFSGDGDKLISEKYNVSITCEDDRYNVYNYSTNELIHEEIIPQENNIDLKDRVEKGKDLIDRIKKEYKEEIAV